MLTSEKTKSGAVLIAFISITTILIAFMLPPMSQPLGYFDFADKRHIFGIPNFFNVISNIPFLIVGLIAIQKLRAGHLLIDTEIKSAYLIFFIGVSLVAFGSGYFHLWPSSKTLVWDRIPMTITFMSLFSCVLAECISIRGAKVALWPLIILGVASVIYWIISEKAGKGDLRFYGLVQFLPMLLLPIILIFFQSKYTLVNAYWVLLICYLSAKLVEHFDDQIYTFLGFISGHTIKHIIAAIGLWIVLNSYQNRKILS